MPPKSGKKKLSKAEKERIKKEEAEKKARDEEEARVQAERDEAERKVRDKLEAEERRQLENEERKKRKGQLQELDDLWDSNRGTLLTERADQRTRSRWARYMLCDGSPDPTVAGEINTYINLWAEDLDNIDIHTVLGDSHLALSLIEELADVMATTPEAEMSQRERDGHRETLCKLQGLLQTKLDLASFDVFRKATDFQNSETLNLQQVIGNDQIRLCAWGNLSKNPRIKSHEFGEVGLTFDIPRVLTLSDCAVRAMFLSYDHLSEHSASFYPRRKVAIQEPPAEEEKPEEDGDEMKDGGDEDQEEDKPEEEGVQREETQDVMAALSALDGDGEDQKEDEEEDKEEEAPLEDDVEIRTPEPEDFEEFEGEDDAVDLRAYQVLGGVLHLNLLHLPPQPKTANAWVITQVVDPPALQYMDYQADGPTPGTQSTEPKNKDEQKDKKDAEKPPIGVALSESGDLSTSRSNTQSVLGSREPPNAPMGVTMVLPSDVYFSEEPQIVRWDPEDNLWRLDGFTDHSFDEEKRLLSFRTAQFGTLALVQDTHINMPFQSWELRPRAANHAQLTIIAAIVEVEIQIKDDLVCLSQPDDKPEISHLIGQWYSPHHFIKNMQKAGLNLFPSCDSSKYVSVQNKNTVTEERMYQQMSLVASSMAFSWSKWNADVPAPSSTEPSSTEPAADRATEPSADRVVVQATEQLQDEPLIEEDWALWLVTKKRTTKLKMTEYDETFSDDHAEGTEFNADMYHMTMELASDEAKDRIRDTNHRFIDSVYTILNSTRLLTYS